MPPSTLPKPLLGEALSKLDRLAEYLYELIDRFFPREAPRLREYVRRRVEGAREVLVHAGERMLSFRRLAPNAFIVTLVSSRAAGRPLRIAPRYYRTLTGGVERVEREPIDELVYHVEIGPYALKCTCPDAVFTAAKADRLLMEAGFPPQAYKYVLCKHVLAGLAALWAAGLIDPTKPPLDEALLRALVTAYLATLPPGKKPRLSRIALVYARGGETSPAAKN